MKVTRLGSISFDGATHRLSLRGWVLHPEGASARVGESLSHHDVVAAVLIAIAETQGVELEAKVVRLPVPPDHDAERAARQVVDWARAAAAPARPKPWWRFWR